MVSSNEVSEIVEHLQGLIAQETGPPAVVVMGPGLGEDEQTLRGNRGGFLHLAIAALKAAEGESQTFERAKWVQQYELDWVITGLKYDADAHSYFPAESTALRRIVKSLVGYTVLILVLVLLIAGIVTIGRWI